ncbi:MAG: thiol-disulfide isomerase/thioredoxin [Flavobacteriaceae bacterium]|jgi:thiol-disulfide isomerase/thioredoxin
MSLTPSNMLPLGTKAPGFELINPVSSKQIKLNDSKGEKGTVIMFICNHCPFVKYVNNELVAIANEYLNKGIGFIAINSNDVINYPEDSPLEMIKTAEENNYPFPYLFDESQEVAKAYDAACTPDFYLFDDQLKLVYRGQLDSSRLGNNIPITGIDLRQGIEHIINNTLQQVSQKSSMGCNIKWK